MTRFLIEREIDGATDLTQDDLAKIALKAPLVADEAGDTVQAAESLPAAAASQTVPAAAAYDVDGVIIVTPEYSRSIPGVLKNALDWSARPYGQASFSGKPTAIIGTSQGPISTAAAQQHLKAILSHYDAPTLGQPEGYVQSTPGLFTDSGEVTNDGTAAFLESYLDAFSRLISRYAAPAEAAERRAA